MNNLIEIENEIIKTLNSHYIKQQDFNLLIKEWFNTDKFTIALSIKWFMGLLKNNSLEWDSNKHKLYRLLRNCPYLRELILYGTIRRFTNKLPFKSDYMSYSMVSDRTKKYTFFEFVK